MSEVRTEGHMPNILAKSLWWIPLDWRKETTEWIEFRDAEWREGFCDNALPESTPMISRHKIFSFISSEMCERIGV